MMYRGNLQRLCLEDYEALRFLHITAQIYKKKRIGKKLVQESGFNYSLEITITILTSLAKISVPTHADKSINVDVYAGTSIVTRRTGTGHPRNCKIKHGYYLARAVFVSVSALNSISTIVTY